MPATLEFLPRNRPMGRPVSEPADSSFAQWLDSTIEAKGINIKTLAAKSGVAQSTVSHLRAGERGVTRDMVIKLVRGFLHDSEDEYEYERLLDSGLRAAVGLPTNDIIYEPDPDLNYIYESVRGADAPRRKMVRSVVEAILKADKNVVGKRPAEDTEEDE